MDVNQFAEVLINSSDFKLTSDWQEYLSKVLDAKTVESTGYLVAMQTKWTHLQNGYKLSLAAQERARAGNREVTPEEWQEVAKQNHGLLPPLVYQSETKTQLKYDSIEIDGDKAVVRYDDGAAQQEAILRKIDGRWFIANIRPIWVHF